MPLNHLFKWIAPYYDKIIKTNNQKEYIELAEMPSDGILLDIGGGTGRITSNFLGLVDQIVNVDVTFEMLQVARNKGISSICSVGEKLPFSDSSISRIIIIDALHHINNQERVVADAVRVLKPGGLILIVEPNYDHIGGKLIRIFEAVLFMRSKFLNDKSIENMLRIHLNDVNLHHVDGNSWFIAHKKT